MMPMRRSLGFLLVSWSSCALASVAFSLWPSAGLAVPTQPNELVNPLNDSPSCQVCHTHDNAMGAQDEPRYAAFYGWQGGLMANAARDPIFWAGVAIASQDHPGETVDCIRCHAPRAFLEGRGDVISIDQLDPADFEGVGCALCHRITDQGELGNARYAVDDVLGPGGEDVPRRGPWDYDPASPEAPPHDSVFDPFTGSSQMCGVCHDVTTERERVDDDGMPIGVGFNEQRTYSEWANSAYAQAGPSFQSCQDCHMPAVPDKPGCQVAVDQFSHPTGGRRHDLVGANRFMVELLRAEYGGDGTGDVNNFFFNQTLDRMDEMLATTATLELAGPEQVNLGEGLSGLAVTVTNNTGHKLPSGYSEGRVMWLEVVARYADQVVWSSGEFVPGVGVPDEPQVRTYQGVAEEFATGQQLHLLLNNHWVEDTRIPPLGLTPDVQTDPVGTRYQLQDDGTWPNFDVAQYAFEGNPGVQDATPADAGDDVLDVQVRLLYLINTPEYVQLLADDNVTNEAGSDVAMLFDTMGGAQPVTLAEASLQIPISAFGEPPPGTTGADATAGTVDDTGRTTSGGSVSGSGAATGSTETGEPGQDDEGGGCGCRARGSGRATWWASWGALALLGLVGRRRRRRAI